MPKNRRSKLTTEEKAQLKYEYTAKRANTVITRQRRVLKIMAALLFISVILNAVQQLWGA